MGWQTDKGIVGVYAAIGFVLLAAQFVPSAEPNGRSDFRADSRMVLVSAAVVDDKNQFVSSLGRDSFRVWDEKSEVAVKGVFLEDVPVSVVILLDASSSMRKTIGYSREALGRLLDHSRPGDEFCLITFSDTARSCDFETEPERVLQRAERVVPEGSTALIDALMLAMRRVKEAANPRKAIVVLSDGVDTHSVTRWRALRTHALESDATLYAVSPPVWSDADEREAGELQDLVEYTGGRFLRAGRAREMAELMELLDVRLQYVIGYVPPPAQDPGEWRRVRVKLRGTSTRNLHLFWRHAYFVPAEQEKR
jgi:Ca-activated chloride channel homolog